MEVAKDGGSNASPLHTHTHGEVSEGTSPRLTYLVETASGRTEAQATPNSARPQEQLPFSRKT